MEGKTNQNELKQLRLRMVTEHPWFPGLKGLKMKGRDLNTLPAELFSIVELEFLDVSPEREASLCYQLPTVPTAIARLVNLKVLMLDTNDLTSIPAEICLLHNLERISLSNNKLKMLPEGFRNLTKLQSLHITNNMLEFFPEEIVYLVYLEYLDLCDNEIKHIPNSINKLENMRHLMLYLNKLERLPDEICELENLRTLWIGDNKIKRLPRHFGNLVNLGWSKHTCSCALKGNPLEHPPLGVCMEGIDSIARYLDAADPLEVKGTSDAIVSNH